jgi:SAM-dependent methyltransferase
VGRSLVYANSFVYEAVMRTLYGRHYGARYRAVADLIPDGSSVVDLCCGPGVLHRRYLRRRGIAYTGLDLNGRFVAGVNRLGARAIAWDLCDARPLPEADFVVMQAGLYQFLPDPSPVVRRMLAAARERVIIAEPVRNLSTCRVPAVAAFASRRANAGQGDQPRRFDERALDDFFGSLGHPASPAFLIPGGREKVYVLDPRHGLEAPTD